MSRSGDEHDPPPILGAWRHLYAFVLIVLVALIVAMWLFTVRFS